MEKQLIIHTSSLQVGEDLRAAGYKNIIDTTVKTGNPMLAPTWELLMEYKNSAMDTDAEDRYTEKFKDMMRHRFANTPSLFDFCLDKERVVLACYCRAGNFCHRHLLAAMLKNVAAKRGYKVIMGGELLEPEREDKPIVILS